MRRWQYRRVLLVCTLAFGAWGVAPARAFADGVPTTTPTITAPVDGTDAVGSVAITATSTAGSVQFFVDATPLGTPVTVAAGTASTMWPTWGLANAGSHALTAADCIASDCNLTQSAAVNVTVNNSAPAVTSPAEGETTGPSATIDADAPGGGVAFFVDGVQVGFDATAPYSFTFAGPMADGPHTTTVTECDDTGATCDGPSSPVVNFSAKTLHPQITSVSPNPFSPHPDGFRDKTTFRIHLPDAETGSYVVRNGSAQVVSGPHGIGSLAAGDYDFGWAGKDNSAAIVPDGLYTIVVSTSAQGGTLHGTASATARVDDTAPLLTGITGNGATFYPVKDGYSDTFLPKVTDNEGATLSLHIFTTHAVPVRVISRPYSQAGTFQFSWDGRNSSGALVADGNYLYHVVAQDIAGNIRISPNREVHLSHKRLVNQTAVFTHNGNAGVLSTSDVSCTGYSYKLSDFAHGVWLDNYCAPAGGFQAVFADYSWSVPSSVRYNNIRVESLGNTVDAPEPIIAIMYNWSTQKWDGVGAVTLTRNSSNHWTDYGLESAAGRVSSSHVVKISVSVPNSAAPEDYDIGTVRITLSYAVLQ